MDLGLKDQVTLVTAASSGVGLASARALAPDGARGALAARSVDRLSEICDELNQGPGQAHAFSFDLTDPEASDRLIAEVQEKWGRLDAVVINGPGPVSGLAHK